MQTLYHIPDRPLGPCVATIGFFDGVHQGHRFLIEQVKEVAAARGLPSALITFPIHPRKVMNPEYPFRLLTTQAEKTALLDETGVDYCFMLDFTRDISHLTAQAFMTHILKERYGVQCLVIGYDHRFGHNRSEGFDSYCSYGEAIGMEVIRAQVYANGEHPVSSSFVRELLLQGKPDCAMHCLGYSYFLKGKVVGGYQLGRTIGFPTANLAVDDPNKLIPADGVYAVYVSVLGRTYKGMLNIGHRPTFDNGNKSIEVNILHFDADIYDQPMRLSFVKYLRPELKFNSVDELVLQMHKDEAAVEALLSEPYKPEK